MKKRLKIILLVCICVPILFWLASLLKCEILTHLHYDEFATAYQEDTMLGEMEYFKVLDYSEETARVYYVSKDMYAASVLVFSKVGDQWKKSRWETIWSTSGSASETIWPYWWHFIYGGF